ncbi:tyrosine-type recombinase/integrase [Butyricicoccus faecihominis]|uniref:tyrosine-type recombinase/integrase n=1 Tax=Butyricicoccus faecihominis TaxID=1712515 RepID=UPI00247A4018|nr:tyrosine-type recombinase/integrase [Butyricicoccus faecihominis]MCQ5130458.1 tyrosine-type recombinase/integrase [Butyricicoccus faecihominis]
MLTEQIEAYLEKLAAAERSAATLSKYRRDLCSFVAFMGDRQLDKTAVVAYKETLTARYAASSVNSMLAAVNGLLAFMERHDCRVRPLKTQRKAFLPPDRELTRKDYLRLLYVASGRRNSRVYLLLQTLGATGIRISELRYITVEAARAGRASVRLKGKTRVVFLPSSLCGALLRYAESKHLTGGPVFITRYGLPMDRSNIWNTMKRLCRSAGVDPHKVFPHNLRHLFARTYYDTDRDLAHLADLLGHSSVDTTRIYTATSGEEQEKRVNALGLVIERRELENRERETEH